MKTYEFDRYRNGTLMAEGIVVEARSLKEAKIKANDVKNNEGFCDYECLKLRKVKG